MHTGQGRLDGAFCDYSEKEKMAYIHHLERNGVTNIEMESLAFAALTHHAGIRAAVVCVAVVDRMKGDQVQSLTHSLTLHPLSFPLNYFISCGM